MAIEDPQQRIEYLKGFRSSMHGTKSVSSLAAWFENIRDDLGAISRPEIRAEAQRLFGLVQSCSYILQRDPDLFPKHFRESLDSLISYLESNDR